MYVLNKKSKKYSCDELYQINGYKLTIKKCKVCVIEPKMCQELVKLKYLPAFEQLIARILLFLDSDPDNEGAEALLGELAREYAVFQNKYEKYVSTYERDKYVRKIRLLCNELKPFTLTKKAVATKGRSL